jgi:membrane-bound lytic murein transglycosylase D
MELARRSELEYPTPLNDRVLAEIQAIQRTYPKSFQAGLNRSGKYLPYIKAEFEKAGLPEDLVWLAMVESQFTPKINSRVGAGGMWQFMRSTGGRYGLSSNTYIDERYDWQKSTQAAIIYLKELYDMFGSWPLAVSAYNMGEGGLERAIASNGGDRNLWRLIETPPAANRIRRETKKFYAKLLASSIVAQNPERYGFTRKPMPEERTTTIQVKGAYALDRIDEQVGLTPGTIASLNPQLIRRITPPMSSITLRVPADMRTQVASAIEGMEELQPSTHIVAKGETLSGIASMHRVSLRSLQDVNHIRTPRSLQIGQRLVIPGRMASNSAGSGATTADGDGRKVYTVARGDSLSRISSKFGTSVGQLQRWNGLGRSTQIHVGDRLFVNASTTRTAESEEVIEDVATLSPADSIYVVRKGDSAYTIAKKHGVSTQSLLEWNGLTKRSILHVGDVLKIRNSDMVVASSRPSFHVVTRGQNPSTIAKRYGLKLNDLYKLNKWNRDPVLQVGQKIVVGQ